MVLVNAGTRISMDGAGRWIGNVFIESLGRSVKYKEVYLHAYGDGRKAQRQLSRSFTFNNDRRLHQALEDCMPDEVYVPAVLGPSPTRSTARKSTSAPPNCCRCTVMAAAITIATAMTITRGLAICFSYSTPSRSGAWSTRSPRRCKACRTRSGASKSRCSSGAIAPTVPAWPTR